MGEITNDSLVESPANPNSLVDGLVGENNPEQKNDFVKYATHKQLLEQHRKTKGVNADLIAQNAKLESDKKEREETEMRDQNRYQELLEARDKELTETRSKLDETNKSIEWADKMRAFQDSLGHSKLDAAYYSLAPIDEIKYGDDGRIDQENLLNVVNSFHSRLIDDPRNDLPNQQPGLSTGKKLSRSEWKLLSSTDMMARFKEVDFTT